ncbi:pyridoxal phosphate-dependent aminotransferase [Patescibacteria group bacterium]|nr:pyridoxal phosphate-dependent aminotransferase [Patescibacteria group bacterium]
MFIGKKTTGNQPLSGREMADQAVAAGAIDMAQGVVHTSPPALFLEVLTSIFNERRTHIYSSPAGVMAYREALLSGLTRERSGLELESVIGTNGVTGGLISALGSVCGPGDGVTLLEPFYPAHAWAIEALQAAPVYVPYADGFSINWDELGAALKISKAFVLANPANPTGTLLSSEDLSRIYLLCQKYGALLIVDEVYKDFVWEGQFSSLLAEAGDLANLVILRSFSKNLALAGWRVGYAVSSPKRCQAMIHNIHEAFYVGATAPPQHVMAILLRDHAEEIKVFIADLVSLYQKNRTAIMAAFTGAGMEPRPNAGAYYMMVQHNRDSDLAATKELLDLGIAVAPGQPFYRPGTSDTGYLRVHFALSSEDTNKVVSILK